MDKPSSFLMVKNNLKSKILFLRKKIENVKAFIFF